MAEKTAAGFDGKRVRKVARERLGFEDLRGGQEEVIRLVLEGHDVLSVMPTGSGKSAIYQIVGAMVGGATVVVSPLIALQKDQVESIGESRLPAAAVINSTISAGERRAAFEKLRAGKLEYLFLAPEQLANEETLAEVRGGKVSLFVVDEAHCVSEWGHDFRPDYGRLGAMIEAVGGERGVRVLALTATASPSVREDVVKRLKMKRARTVVWGFDRPNIYLEIERCPDEETKKRLIVDRVRDGEKPMIVYAGTHAHAEEIVGMLGEQNVEVACYHGGMKKDARTEAQDRFMTGGCDIVVATNAFGMGVDKADVRTVIHYDVSESLDSYYQEVGRAGRDGEPARALMLYRPEDLGMRRAMASQGMITEEHVGEVIAALEEAGGAGTAGEIAEGSEISEGKVEKVLNRLAEAGVVKVGPTGEAVAKSGKVDVKQVAEGAVREQELYREYRRARVELIKEYAETEECRRKFVLNYFGEEYAGLCGACDNCKSGLADRALTRSRENPIEAKARVRHKKYGEGQILRYEGDKVVVLFDKEGQKELVTKFVLENGLMEKL
jgi:ATP-dependent DNA helicase RecQ